MNETIGDKMMTELKRMYVLKHLPIDDYAVDTLAIYNEFIAKSEDMKVYEAQAFFENGDANGTLDVWEWIKRVAMSSWKPDRRFFTVKDYMNGGDGLIFSVDFGEKEINQLTQFIINASDKEIEYVFTANAMSMTDFQKEMAGEKMAS